MHQTSHTVYWGPCSYYPRRSATHYEQQPPSSLIPLFSCMALLLLKHWELLTHWHSVTCQKTLPFSNSTGRNSHLAPCRLIHTNILEELHVSIIKVEFYTIFKTRASRFLHNVAVYLSDCTVSYPRLTAITWSHWSTKFIQSRKTYLNLSKISNMKSTVA